MWPSWPNWPSWNPFTRETPTTNEEEKENKPVIAPTTTTTMTTTVVSPPSSSPAPAASRPSLGLTSTSTGASLSGGTAPADAPDGFWGFVQENVAADNDPALDDMMQYFGFAHQVDKSDYVGAVQFQLTYNDGRTVTKTVQVMPKLPAKVKIEEIKDEAGVKSAPMARFISHTAAAATVSASSSPSQLAAAPSSLDESRLRKFLPLPCCTLVVPARAPVAVDPLDSPMPTVPFSPRIRIFDGPIPSDVKLSAQLLCPRDVFFDVYMGRLDPIQSVLSRKAHCPGFRYMELMRFGQSFLMGGDVWVRFYAAQKEAEEQKQLWEAKKKGSGSGGGKGSGGKRGGGSGGISSGNMLTGNPTTASSVPSSNKSSSLLMQTFARILPSITLHMNASTTTITTTASWAPLVPLQKSFQRANALVSKFSEFKRESLM